MGEMKQRADKRKEEKDAKTQLKKQIAMAKKAHEQVLKKEVIFTGLKKERAEKHLKNVVHLKKAKEKGVKATAAMLDAETKQRERLQAPAKEFHKAKKAERMARSAAHTLVKAKKAEQKAMKKGGKAAIMAAIAKLKAKHALARSRRHAIHMFHKASHLAHVAKRHDPHRDTSKKSTSRAESLHTLRARTERTLEKAIPKSKSAKKIRKTKKHTNKAEAKKVEHVAKLMVGNTVSKKRLVQMLNTLSQEVSKERGRVHDAAKIPVV